MHRLAVVTISLVLLAGSVAPAAPVAGTTGPLPPDSSAMVTPAGAPASAPDSLRRLGTLRIRAIGIAATVYAWGCGSAVVPDLVLRWGCNASRNQFLVGHAYGVFHGYYLAYKEHRLTRGMIATFTDRYGRVTRYTLAWVRKVPKNYIWNGQTGEVWAWGNTPQPSLTLQTCWGATNAYRIITRFVKG